MIPQLDTMLTMNEAGNLPMWQIVSYIVKYVGQEGTKADFDALSATLRKEVIQAIDSYKREGGWFVISNNGTENYGPYADRFMEKVGRDVSA